MAITNFSANGAGKVIHTGKYHTAEVEVQHCK
jgi:hypothetical protein